MNWQNLSLLEIHVLLMPFLVGAFAARLDPRLGAIAGLAALATGPFFMAQFDVSVGYTSLVLGMVLFGIGLGLYMPSITTEAVQADDRDRKCRLRSQCR